MPDDGVEREDAAQADEPKLPAEVEVFVVEEQARLEQPDPPHDVEPDQHARPGGVGDVPAVPRRARKVRDRLTAAERVAEAEEMDRVADRVEPGRIVMQDKPRLDGSDRRIGFHAGDGRFEKVGGDDAVLVEEIREVEPRLDREGGEPVVGLREAEVRAEADDGRAVELREPVRGAVVGAVVADKERPCGIGDRS